MCRNTAISRLFPGYTHSVLITSSCHVAFSIAASQTLMTAQDAALKEVPRTRLLQWTFPFQVCPVQCFTFVCPFHIRPWSFVRRNRVVGIRIAMFYPARREHEGVSGFAATTHNSQVFSFYPDGGVAHGLDDALRRYKEVAPHVKLAGPTSFAPIIHQALRLVAENGHYHILVIIADGQVRVFVTELCSGHGS